MHVPPAVALPLAAALVLVAPARAQQPITTDPPARPLTIIETPSDAVAAEARAYARHYDVPVEEANRRLRAQQESVVFTDSLAAIYAGRLAGIAIEHRPDFAIRVLLTGDAAVPDTRIFAGGMNVPVRFQIGATATRAQVDAVLASRAAELRTLFPMTRGIGFDMRSGEIVAMVQPNDVEAFGAAELSAGLSALLGAPVRVRPITHPENMMLAGGSRVSGPDPASARRFACTAGFVVTDGARSGVATAAHCPDQLSYADPSGARIPLAFAGQWGARDQDVQIGISPAPLGPIFYGESDMIARPLTGARKRLATRAGEFVCHRGEGSGYSCAEVDLVDYAPPGDLCGGPCDASWIMVRPICKSGDSGGPVFSGSIAYGIVKGRVRDADGACAGYFYMSTDYLPEGWRLSFD